MGHIAHPIAFVALAGLLKRVYAQDDDQDPVDIEVDTEDGLVEDLEETEETDIEDQEWPEIDVNQEDDLSQEIDDAEDSEEMVLSNLSTGEFQDDDPVVLPQNQEILPGEEEGEDDESANIVDYPSLGAQELSKEESEHTLQVDSNNMLEPAEPYIQTKEENIIQSTPTPEANTLPLGWQGNNDEEDETEETIRPNIAEWQDELNIDDEVDRYDAEIEDTYKKAKEAMANRNPPWYEQKAKDQEVHENAAEVVGIPVGNGLVQEQNKLDATDNASASESHSSTFFFFLLVLIGLWIFMRIPKVKRLYLNSKKSKTTLPYHHRTYGKRSLD